MKRLARLVGLTAVIGALFASPAPASVGITSVTQQVQGYNSGGVFLVCDGTDVVNSATFGSVVANYYVRTDSIVHAENVQVDLHKDGFMPTDLLWYQRNINMDLKNGLNTIYSRQYFVGAGRYYWTFTVKVGAQNWVRECDFNWQ